MKSISFTIFLSLISSASFGQIEFIDKLYAQVVFENLTVYREDMNELNNKELFNLLYQIDTIPNCFGEIRDKFVNCIYYEPSISIVRSQNEIDTISDQNYFRFLNFYAKIKNDIGEELRINFIFRMEKEFINKLDDIQIPEEKNLNISTGEDEFWAIDEILIGDKRFYLDSCHLNYNLKLESDQKFQHSFNDKEYSCSDSLNVEAINDNEFFNYWNNKISHNLNFMAGRWRTIGNSLLFINDELDYIQSFEFENPNSNELVLKHEKNYLIKLKKKASQ